jgi:hypothetical protein
MLIVEIDNAAHHLATILQYFKQEADSKKQPAVIPIQSLSQFFADQGITINTDTIKNLINTNPEIKNLIKSFDGDKITIDTEIETEPGGEIKGSDEVSKMAKRALNKRS